MTTTTDTPRTMTNEQINIAVAEALGEAVEWHDGIPYWLGMWSSVGEGNESFAEFKPTYDLNAMHEAEKTLSSAQLQREYADILDDGNGGHFATALQRAEAFLEIIRKSKK